MISRHADNPVRRQYRLKFAWCQYPGCERPGSDIHEIARGCGIRRNSVKLRSCLLHLCREHHQKMQCWQVVRQLALKMLVDPKGYDRREVNTVRGRQPDAITQQEVDRYVAGLIPRDCSVCGKRLVRRPRETSRKFKRRKCCSPECGKICAGCSRSKPLPVRYCRVCGQRILQRGARKYCSLRCRGIGRRKPVPVRYCRVCGKRMVKKKNMWRKVFARQKYCCWQCKHDGLRLRPRG